MESADQNEIEYLNYNHHCFARQAYRKLHHTSRHPIRKLPDRHTANSIHTDNQRDD